ncbi:MAG: Tetratricopeptide 2 repeat protein, partial [Chthonomonadales bacterium]|nr:Tetratricopeptide 2 repeat protein [Chthonomonadales bacterium]
TAFGLLWKRYEARVVSRCRHYLNSPHRDPATDAEDLANETFILALHGLHRYEDRTQQNQGFEAWLLEIARRLCLKFLARQRRRRQWHRDAPDDLMAEYAGGVETARLIEERELLRIVAQEINALPDLYRLPFKLSLEEFSHKEIAETLGISVDSAMQRVHRARRMLRPRVAPLFGAGIPAPMQTRRSHSAFRVVEQALSEIVSDLNIVNITLPGGGEFQLCLRVDRQRAQGKQVLDIQRRRLQRHPRAWKPYLEFAELCYHSGHWPEAREAYRTALHRNPACFAAALSLGEMLRKEEQTAEAIQIYEHALNQLPPPEIAAQLKAEYLATTGEDAQAADAYREALGLAPKEKPLYYGLHRVLGRLSRYADQLENLAALREIAPDDIFAYDEAYLPCARMQRWDIALPLLEHAVAIDPNHPLALKHLFQVRMNQKRYDGEALALAERLVRLAPNFVESWSELAWIYAELGREEESLAVLQQFLAEHPTNAEAYAALAWRCHYLERMEELAVYARRAYELAPHNWHVCWTLLKACEFATTAISEAERFHFAAEIAGRFPQDAFLMEQFCYFYATWERAAEALAYARRLQALRPDTREQAKVSAEIYRLCRHWPEAVRELRLLVELPEGGTPVLLAQLGEALMGVGDLEAQARFQEAEREAQTWQDYLFLVEVYARCGLIANRDAAAEVLFTLPSLPESTRRHVERLQQRR